MRIPFRAVGQISAIDINRREANDAAAKIRIHRDRNGLGLRVRVARLVVADVVAQGGEVGGERPRSDRLVRALLLRIAPVRLRDLEPCLAVRLDPRKAVRVAVAVEEAVVVGAMVGNVGAGEGAVAIGHFQATYSVAVGVGGGVVPGHDEGFGKRAA